MRSIEGEGAVQKRWARVGEWLDALLAGHGRNPLEGVQLTEIRIRMPTEEDPMVLLIVKAAGATGKSIAFVGAGTPVQALLAWRKRDAGPGLKWREDKPWGEE